MSESGAARSDAEQGGAGEPGGVVRGFFVGMGFFGGMFDGDVGEFPCGAVFEQAGDERSVHEVAGALGDDVAFDAAAGEGEIADEVENLVADVLVAEAERAVLRAFGAEDDGVFRAGAADEAHVAEALLVGLVAEGAGGCDESAVGFGGEINAGFLLADGGGELDGVVDAVALAGVDADELVAFADFDGLEDADGLAAAALGADAGALESCDVGLGAAVKDGQLEVVELDDDVVHAHADEGGEQVLGGGDEHALAHEAGGVADLGDVAADGGDLEVVEVGAAEDDAGAGGRGEQAHGDGRAGVQTYPGELEGLCDGLLQVGGCSQKDNSCCGKRTQSLG